MKRVTLHKKITKQLKEKGNPKNGLLRLISSVLIVGFCLLCIKNQACAQASLQYPLKINEVEIGFTMGTIFLAAEVELSVTLLRRVSKFLVLEVKPLIGFLGTTYKFNDLDQHHEYLYSGGTLVPRA